MLICPACQSKNLNNHKFCQDCGTSLIYTNCHNCGSEISLISLKCQHCNTSNAKKLTALITSEAETKLELASSVKERGKSQNLEPFKIATKGQSQIAQQYLDSQQRYYLVPESTPLAELPISVIHTQVIDKFPLKESYLDGIKKQKEELFSTLGQDLSYSDFSVARDWSNIGVPTIALPYLMLQHYTPVIPPVYDTWQDKSLGALLLCDRSEWNLLTDLWSSANTPQEQILWSLNEMLKYWTPLAKIGCITTLLIEDNLRIDEDDSLGFAKLYFDPQDNSPKLNDLAAKWHEWLSKYPKKYAPELETIIQKAIAKKMTSIQDFQKELYGIVTPKKTTIEAEEKKEDTETVAGEDLFIFENQEIDSLFGNNEIEDQPTAALAMEIANVTDASCTDIDSARDHNEDFFGVKTTITQEENPSQKTVDIKGLYVVCDGMGGHSAGEVASAMAVETLQSYFHTYWQDEFPDEETIKEGILLANRTIYQTNVDHNRSGHGMMGTTLVMALLHNNQLAIAHVGDSRIYRVTRTFGLEQLTQDHEVGQREINRGVEPEIAYGRPDAYQLTQALGPRNDKYIKPAIESFEIYEDCLILLCSDGLCDNNLVEKHWETYLKPLISSSADIQAGLFQLIDFADRYNGHDNITGILLRIKLQPYFETQP